MRIDRVEGKAFGPFAGDQLELTPGLNIIHGPNESGKSSWHAALYAGLCGMRRGKGARLIADREFARRRQPWTGKSWAVGVTLTRDDGTRIEMHHDLAGQVDCRATDVAVGRDISATMMFDGSPDGSRLLGLNRRTMLSTVCVRQADLLGLLGDAKELQETLQKAAATAGADATAEAALTCIAQFHREKIGTERANATKPLRKAVVAAEDAEEALEEAQVAHSAHLQLVVRRDRAQQRVDDAAEQLAAVRGAVAREALRELEERVVEVSALSSRAGDSPPRDVSQDDEVANAVAVALAAYENRPSVDGPLAGTTSAELEAQISALPSMPSGDLEPHHEVTTAHRAWERAADALKLHEKGRPEEGVAGRKMDAAPGELRQAADDLESAVPSIDPELAERIEYLRATPASSSSNKNVAWGGAGALALLGVVAIVLNQPVVAVVLMAAAVGGVIFGLRSQRGGIEPSSELPALEARLAFQSEAAAQAQRRRDAAAARAAEWNVGADPAELRRLARETEDLDTLEQRRHQWQAARDELAETLASAASDLTARLIARDVSVDDGLAAAMESYCDACRERSALAAAAARRDDLQALLEGRLGAEREQTERSQRRRDAEAAVVDAAVAAGLSGNDVDELAAALHDWLEQRASTLEQNAAALDDWRRLQFLLDGASVEELTSELERRRAALPVEPATSVRLESDTEAQLARLVKEHRELADAAAEIRGETQTSERNLPSVAEAEEALERARAEEQRLRRLDRTLATATELLTKARDDVHRTIAPKLQSGVEQRLSKVTSGRYREVTVDPQTLQVQVRDQGGSWRDAALLSHGTAEQVYLLLRLAMAEHLCTTGETAPLILDDVTVQSDSDRTVAILELLHEMSRDRQIVLFTQEDDVLAWAKRHITGGRDQLMQLEGPRSLRAVEVA